jgi:PPP family 3-phenylpropionic acid transporter
MTRVQKIRLASMCDLWTIRLVFFFNVGSSAFLMPFLSLYFSGVGLNGAQIGLASMVAGIAGLLAAPAWGRWNDLTAHPRRLLQVGLCATALFQLILSQQSTFLWIIGIISLESITGAGIEPLLNILALKTTQSIKRVGFGSVRLWGSLGWAIFALISGWVIEQTSLRSGFYGSAAFLIISTLTLGLMSQGLADHPVHPTHFVESQNGQLSLKAVINSLFSNRTMIGVSLTMIAIWMAGNGLHQFQPIYMKQLGARESLIGLTATLAALVELPAMLLADRLLQRYPATTVIRLALYLSSIRVGWVLLWPSLSVIVMSEAINAVAFSLEWVALVNFIHLHAPFEQASTVMALFSVTLSSLVRILASPLSGLAFDHLGAFWLYAIALGAYLVGWLTLNLSFRRQPALG